MSELCIVLARIAECLDRIAETLPGSDQEAFQEKVKEAVISILASERTHLEYK